MNVNVILLIVLCLMFAFIASGLWMGISLGLAGALSILLFTNYPLGDLISTISFSTNDSFVLISIPFFLLMGEFLLHSGLSEKIYSGISPWVARIPGGLLHTNVIASSMYAAMIGTSAVITATVSATAIPELKKRGYSQALSIGSISGVGTLGYLIPPSAPMIIYGAMVGESVGQLFMAGLIPGLMLSFLFICYIAIASILRPTLVPSMSKSYSWKEKIAGLRQLLPAPIIIALVLGLIYGGIVTPTESAAIGAFAAFCLCLLYKSMNWQILKKSLFETVRISCMVMFIITGASILKTAVSYLGVASELCKLVVSLNLSPYIVLTIIILVYLALGCILDGVSMILLTLPIIYPLIIGLGFNGIWFAVVMVVLIEAAQITPPVGMNLFVLEKISGIPLLTIAKYSIPFFLIMLLQIMILTFFPEIALWLPNTMKR